MAVMSTFLGDHQSQQTFSSPTASTSTFPTSYSLATSFLTEHESIHEIVLPSLHHDNNNDDDDDQDNGSNDADDQGEDAELQPSHALYTTTFALNGHNQSTKLNRPSSAAGGGFVLSRVVDQGHSIELSYNSFFTHTATTSSSLDNVPLNTSWAPIRFILPAHPTNHKKDKIIAKPFIALNTSTDNDHDDPGELQIYFVTESSQLYILHFNLPKLFYSAFAFNEASDAEEQGQMQQDDDDDDDDDDESSNPSWCEVFQIKSTVGKLPVLMHGIDVSSILVACADGYATSLIVVDGENLTETELRSTSNNFFKVRSLLPSFSTRNLSSIAASPPSPNPSLPSIINYSSSSALTNSSSPSQIVSFASTSPQDSKTTFGFSVSRDRKLKVWNLDTGSVLKSIDLPRPNNAATSTSNALVASSDVADVTDSPARNMKQPSGLLLPPTPQSFVKLVNIAASSSSPYSSYLILFSPSTSSSSAAFFIYGIATDFNTGSLNELTPVGEKVCSRSNGPLIDFKLGPIGLQGKSAGWTLWTLWDEAGGETVVRTIALPELDEQALMLNDSNGGQDEGEAGEDSDRWTVVDSGTAGLTNSWTPAHFDELYESDPSGKVVAATFIEHVSYPGRYPLTSLDHALTLYERQLENELESFDYRPGALALFYETVLERIIAVVGCTVTLTQSSQTGAWEYDAYNRDLRLEWLRFVSMLNDSRRAALFPTCIEVEAEQGLAFVATREAIVVPVAQDSTSHLVDAFHSSRQIQLPFLSHSVSHLLECIQLLRSSCLLSCRRSLENAIAARLIDFSTAAPIEAIACELYDSNLATFIDEEVAEQIHETFGSIGSAEQAITSLSEHLTVPPAPKTITTSKALRPSDLLNSLLTDQISSIISSRHELAFGLATLLIFLNGEQNDSEPIPFLERLTSRTFATFHTLSSLRWIAEIGIAPSAEAEQAWITSQRAAAGEEEDVFSQFDRMNVNRNGSANGDDEDDEVPSPTPSSSLLKALVRSCYPVEINSRPASSIHHSLLDLSLSFLSSTGLVTPKSIIVDSQTDAILAMRIYELGLPELAIQFIERYPTGAGMMYVKGLSMLAIGQVENAEVAFAKAAPALYFDIEDAGLQQILPTDASNSLPQFYTHVVSLFVDHGFDSAVVRFAQLALEAFDDTDPTSSSSISATTTLEDLWLQLFRSQAFLGSYEDAFMTLMAVPYPSVRSTCLAHLISVMCENGAVAALTRFGFVGLEAELERNLAFRARNSDPLQTPNYYKILYSYHIAKGDFRSAGTIMYQQARRIGESFTRNASFKDLATLQCQSYLAALNAFSLVAKEHAWVAVVVASNSSESGSSSKRRRISYNIPEEELSKEASNEIDIVELSDVRREYTIALSRLQLSAEFPELERTNFGLDGNAVVSLFSQTGAFEAAFQAARVLEVDMSSLFEIVTDRCVDLSRHPDSSEDASWVSLSEEAASWDGTLAAKAWRLLENHLTRHDDSTLRYRMVVLERTLAIDPTSPLPQFLTEHLLNKDPASLLRALIKYERLQDAFVFSLEVVKKSATPAQLASSSLPYSIFNQLLTLSPKDTAALSKEALTAKQMEVRKAIEGRIAQAEKSERTAFKNLSRD